MVSYQYAPATDGGAERQAQCQAEALVKRGWGVSVVTARWPGLPARERLNGVNVHRVFAIPRAHFLSATFLPSLARFMLMHGHEYDVWHVHQAYYNAWIVLELAQWFNRPAIVKLAASGRWGDFQRIRGRFLESRVLNRLRNAAAIVTLNVESSREAEAIGVRPGSIHLIPNGIDTAAFEPASNATHVAARVALGIPEGGAVVVYAGRLAAEKGIWDLLAAWRSVSEGNAGTAHLIVAGGGNVAEVANAARALSNVHVIGKVRDIRPVLAAADVLVLPSYSEGVSNAVLEAMAMGVPVVGTRIPGIMEPVADGITGLLVEPGDIRELGNAISHLIASDQMVSMRSASRQRAVESYDLERRIDQYESLYLALATRTG